MIWALCDLDPVMQELRLRVDWKVGNSLSAQVRGSCRLLCTVVGLYVAESVTGQCRGNSGVPASLRSSFQASSAGGSVFPSKAAHRSRACTCILSYLRLYILSKHLIRRVSID